MKEKERSSKTVISTGVMRPFSACVCALNALQNSMMLTPCCPSAGPTGGAGLACPPGICSLISVRTFLAISVQLLDLVEGQLDGNLPLEDVDEHLELLLVGVHIDDLAVEVRERAGRYLHRLAERVLDLCTWPLAVAAPGVQDAVDLGLRERDGLCAGADEAGDSGRVLHDRPRLVGHVHVDEDIAREHALFGLDLLALFRLDHLLGRDDDAAEARCLVHGHDPVLEIGLHLVLVPRVSVDDVPAEHGLGEQPLDEVLEDDVAAPEEDAHDEACDQDDGDALDQLVLAGPLDLLELAPRLGDEPARATAGRAACLALRPWLTPRLRHGTRGRPRRAGRRATLKRSFAGGHVRTVRTSLGTSLARHQRVSRWPVCLPHQRQYLLTSSRS